MQRKALIRKGNTFEETALTNEQLGEWFKKHVDKATGKLSEEIVLFEKCKIKSNSDGSIRFVFSDNNIDRDNEIIDPKGWKLTNYMKNPVVLWGHEMRTPAIGKSKNIGVIENRLEGDILFDENNDPFAKMIAGKVRGGFLCSGSVGFMPLVIEWIEDESRLEDWVFREQELYEFSIVNVPSNVNATAKREISLDRGTTDNLSVGLGAVVENTLENFFLQDGHPGEKNYIKMLLSSKDDNTNHQQPAGDSIEKMFYEEE